MIPQRIPTTMKGKTLGGLGRTAQNDVDIRLANAVQPEADFSDYSPSELKTFNDSYQESISQPIGRQIASLSDELSMYQDPENEGVSVAETITPNKEEVTVVDQNGNAQQITQPATSGLGSALRGLGNWLHEDSSGDPQDYWRHKYTDGKHIPTGWLRNAGLAEAKMYGDSSMRDARQANLLRQSLNELNKRYTMRQLGSVGNLKENRENYVRQFNDLNAQLQALTGTSYTMLNTSNDPQLNAAMGKELQKIAPDIQVYNTFVDPSVKQEHKVLLAQQIMRDLSGDKGALTNYDIGRFNFALMPDYMRDQYRNSIANMLKGFKSAATQAKGSQYRNAYNRGVDMLNAAVNSDNAIGAARTVNEAIQNVEGMLPANDQYLLSLKNMLETWNQTLGSYAAADVTGVANVLKSRISNKQDLARIWGESNSAEGMDELLQKQFKLLNAIPPELSNTQPQRELPPLEPPMIRQPVEPIPKGFKRNKKGKLVPI